MNKRLQKLFSVLCALALLLGCFSAFAEGADKMTVTVVSLDWQDANDQDALRPAAVTAYLYAGDAQYGQAELNEENNWTNMLAVPAAGEYTWKLASAPKGYALAGAEKGGTTVLTLSHTPDTISVSAKALWAGDENAASRRPAAQTAQLLADGVPAGVETLTQEGGWTAVWANLPRYKNEEGKAKAIAYTLTATAPEGYQTAVSGTADTGFAIANTMESGKLTVAVKAEGAEGASLGALRFEISGPDDRLPMTVSYSALSGGYVLSQAPAGAYLVKEIYADGAVEGYEMDPKSSTVVGSAVIKGGDEQQITLTNVFVQAGEEISGTKKDAEAPSAEELGQLTFVIDGPDSRMPMTITYAQFTGGKFQLDNLKAGTYTVVETNAGKILDGYTLVIEESNQGASMVVGLDGQTAKLTNAYEKLTPTEEPTPEPSKTPEATPEVTPEPTPEPTPAAPELISVPVVKTWVDSDNKDGNRPASVTVRLLANGAETASVTLSDANGWNYLFDGLRRYDNANNEIVYTVTEDAVPLYDAVINGGSITNIYHPEVTSATVRKVWDDNGNSAGLRPTTLYMTLSNGKAKVATVVLSEANNWTMTVNNLPTVIDGQPAVYTWSEQETLGYQLKSKTVEGNVTTFTNAFYQRPTPPEGVKPPKNPGTPYLIIEEYGTPLGIEIYINHVGDCFD